MTGGGVLLYRRHPEKKRSRNDAGFKHHHFAGLSGYLGSHADHSQLLTPQRHLGAGGGRTITRRAAVGKPKQTLRKPPGLTINTQDIRAAWDRTALRRNPQNLDRGELHNVAKKPRGRRGRRGNG